MRKAIESAPIIATAGTTGGTSLKLQALDGARSVEQTANGGKCPQCGAAAKKSARYCEECGAELKKAVTLEGLMGRLVGALRKAAGLHPAMHGYIRNIRNPAKQTYAHAYARWLTSGMEGAEPARPEGLGAMGAQAVRMDLHKMHEEMGTGEPSLSLISPSTPSASSPSLFAEQPARATKPQFIPRASGKYSRTAVGGAPKTGLFAGEGKRQEELFGKALPKASRPERWHRRTTDWPTEHHRNALTAYPLSGEKARRVTREGEVHELHPNRVADLWSRNWRLFSKALPPAPPQSKPLEEHRIPHAHRTIPKKYREAGATRKQMADPGSGKYPTDSPERVRAAIAYFSRFAESTYKDSDERRAVAARIARAARKFGVEVSDEWLKRFRLKPRQEAKTA